MATKERTTDMTPTTKTTRFTEPRPINPGPSPLMLAAQLPRDEAVDFLLWMVQDGAEGHHAD